MPGTYKTGSIKLLLFWCLNLCSDFVKLHHEINIWKTNFSINNYPLDFADKCIKEFFDRVLTGKVVSTVSKKDLMIVLPYLGKLSLQIRTRINHIRKNKLHHCTFRIVFQTKFQSFSSYWKEIERGNILP